MSIDADTLTAENVALLRGGDEQTFAQLIAELECEIRAIVYSFAADRDEAEELMQETWARIYLRRTQYCGKGTLRHWILTVCRNLCLQRARAARRRKRLLLRAPWDALVSEPPTVPEPVSQHLVTLFHRVWRQLPPRQQRVLRMSLVEQQPIPAIARRLDIPEGTVRSDLHRCRHSFRQAVAHSKKDREREPTT